MSLPPTGTVTFLFTDIEGSTTLWEQNPDAMRPALARHDALLHHHLTQNGGFVFKTVGDAFCAAFATAPEAVRSALAAQIALDAQTWETPLRVRMALHTGAGEERDGDYFGPPLNRIARLLSAGHGGQTLLSLSAQELARDALPADAGLKYLGEHRLKDLGRPEQVFQLLHPGLAADFPPLKSLDSSDLPNNLPQQVTSFVGREKEMGEVKRLLDTARLLTLTGTGGGGKTRLSLQVAADLLDKFPGGVWLVELAPLADPSLVAQTVADALGVREEPGRAVARTLAEWLKPKRLLLILDNCEHVLSTCASLASDLIRLCPNVHILTSSREPFGIAGEQTYRVPPLSLPDPLQTQTAERLSQYEAVRLFIERARLVQPAFSITDANAPAVAQICFHLDGIPLAIELAAARVRSLSVEEVNARLDQRFRLLTGGSRTALPRQRTLQALIDWSYDLLTDREKAIFERVSVFAGGWDLEAAEAVCMGGEIADWDILDLLTDLADKSLVVAETAARGTRYYLLETIRQYGDERLQQSGGADAAHARHRDHFLNWAVKIKATLSGPEQSAQMDRLEAEHDNMRVALAWCEQNSAGSDSGLRLATALWRFWFARGYLSEGRQWLERMLACDDDSAPSPARPTALNLAGNMAQVQGDYGASHAFYEQALALHRSLGNSKGIASACNNLGNLVASEGDSEAARALYEESLNSFQAGKVPTGRGGCAQQPGTNRISRWRLRCGASTLGGEPNAGAAGREREWHRCVTGQFGADRLQRR